MVALDFAVFAHAFHCRRKGLVECHRRCQNAFVIVGPIPLRPGQCRGVVDIKLHGNVTHRRLRGQPACDNLRDGLSVVGASGTVKALTAALGRNPVADRGHRRSATTRVFSPVADLTGRQTGQKPLNRTNADIRWKTCGHRNTFQPPTLQLFVRAPFSANSWALLAGSRSEVAPAPAAPYVYRSAGVPPRPSPARTRKMPSTALRSTSATGPVRPVNSAFCPHTPTRRASGTAGPSWGTMPMT